MRGMLAYAAPHPFVEPAPQRAQYTSYSRHADYVPVADGTRLAVTWYLPSGGPAAQSFPVLLWYMPGHREAINPITGEIRPGMNLEELAFLTGHGYAVAVAEMRGSGASFGFRVIDRGPQIGVDGRDLVNWIAGQPWCSGKVGMIGVSYQGFSQFATAAEQPPALKAIFPEIAGFDDYTSLYYPGGILNIALARVAYAAMGRDDRNEFDPDATPPRLPSVPIIDENADGKVSDDIPRFPQGKGSFLDTPPRYSDGQARADVYWQATLAHLKNGVLTNENISTARFRDSVLGTTAYRYWDLDPGSKPSRVVKAGIAVYNRGGWFDYHARDTTQWFGTLHGHVPDRLLMAPTGHGGLPSATAGTTPGNAYLRHFGDSQTSNALVLNEKLRFFDRYLRDVRNGFEAEPPVLIYVMGKGWRREDEWPLKRARTLRMSLGAKGVLEERPGSASVDDWPVDMRANSLSQGANRWNFGIAGAKAPMSLDASLPHRLAYTSAPLGKEREITGHPVVQITLGSNADSTDVYAYLEDVAPDGSSLLVSEGQLRANFHRLRPSKDMLPEVSALRVQPVLPWHGYRKTDFDPAPFANGKVVRMEFDLMPTAWVFRAGHRIRLSLAGADQDSFEPSLASSKDKGTNATPTVPVWHVHRGAGQSVLLLPWVP
ncbi:MAG: CocE/NonD family hydrolase [Pseudomonadota bacterium]